MPVEQVRSFLFDKDGSLRGKSLYGVQFSKDQAHALAEGKAVVIGGLRKDGTEFKCCAQFDAAQRQVVACHPKWFQEALRAGMDGGQSQSKSQGQNQSQSQDKSNSTSQKASQDNHAQQAQQSQKSQAKSAGMRK